MTIATELTDFGCKSRIDVYHLCKQKAIKETTKQEGVLKQRVFHFEDGSSVEMCESGYWTN